MKWWLPVILCSLLLATNNTKAQIQLDDRDSYSLNGYALLLEENKPLSIQEAYQNFTEHKFNLVPTPDNEFNLPMVNHIYWFAIPIKAPQNNISNLETGIANAGVFHLEYYLVSYPDGKVLYKRITGKYYDFFTRAVINRDYYFPVKLPAGSAAIIFYRIDLRGNGFHTPLRLVQKSYRQQTELPVYLFYAFFCGLLLFVAFFSLASFLWTKDRLYLFYSLYVICCCLLFLADGDLDVEWLYPHWPAWTTIAPSMYGAAIMLFMLLFMSDFLRLKSTHQKLFLVTKVWTALLMILLIAIPAGFNFSGNINMRMVVYYYGAFCITGGWLLQIYCIICRIKDKYRLAYLYGAAVISVVVSAAVYFLHSFNIISIAIPPFNYLLLGFAVEIFILSFALIYNYSFFKTKHQQLSVKLANEQLNFSRQLIQLQEAEQKRIAEDLHDELGGNLAAIKMNLQSLHLPDEDISNNIIQLIDKASDNARHIAHNLMPPEFAKTGLCDLLQTFFNRLNAENNIHFHYHSSGEDHQLNKQDDLMIYRIVMELTNNIIKHSKAKEATIQLIYYETYLEIMAEDNGSGFSAVPSNGMGITNIESRVNYLQGKMNIDSSVHGTTIMIKVPYKK